MSEQIFRDSEADLSFRARRFAGKTLIPPAQIAPANRVFTPSDEEVAWARTVLSAPIVSGDRPSERQPSQAGV